MNKTLDLVHEISLKRDYDIALNVRYFHCASLLTLMSSPIEIAKGIED